MTPEQKFQAGRDAGRSVTDQLRATFLAFKDRPKTMLQVAAETGILRANICRYVSTFRKLGQIKVVRFGDCPLSGHRAGFYLTDGRTSFSASLDQTPTT